MIARYRPEATILALTPFDRVARQLQLVWGVIPIKVGQYDNIESLPDVCDAVLTERKLIKRGESYVITGGVPMGVAGTTNYLSVQTF